MRPLIIAGNWKMHGSRTLVARLLAEVKAELPVPCRVQLIIFPPFVYLEAVERMLKGSPLYLGAQNMNQHGEGALTGEISSTMLLDMHCTHVLLGHSERRTHFGESDVVIAEKFVAACRASLIPLLCVGETLEERKAHMTEEVVLRQLEAVLAVSGVEAFSRALLAYEPVWAIGTGLSATPEQAEAVHQLIRDYIGKRNEAIAEGLPILYGGSLNPKNTAKLLRAPNIDGGLVGSASLSAEDFVQIVRIADNQAIDR